MRAAVIGGGMAGLAAAHALAGAGAEVTLLEASGRFGGPLRTTPLAGLPLEEGADAFLVRAPQAADLARLVGCELVHPAASRAWLLAGGRLRPLPAGTVLGVPGSLAQLRGILTPLGQARAALDVLAPASRFGADPSVGELVRRRLGHQVLDRLVDPLLGGVYAGAASGLSVRAVVPLLADPGRSLLRTVADRRPAATTGPVFGSVVGGVGAFPAALADAVRALGGELRTGVPVTGLRTAAGGWEVLTGPAGRQARDLFDAIVLALPAGAAARLLAGTVAPALLPTTAYSSVAIVTVVYPPGTPTPDGSGILVAPSEHRMVKAVTFVGRKWAHAADAPVVIRASVGRFGEEADLQRPDVELAGVAAAEIAAIAGVPGRPLTWRVSRWGGALPQYTPGHPGRVAALRAALPAGLALAGAGYDGVGVPAVVASGQAAAAAVLRAEVSDPRRPVGGSDHG